MARPTTLSVLTLLLLAAGPGAQVVRITIEGSITNVEVAGPTVKGTILLRIVNGTETPLGNVTLQLATPASGWIGEQGSVSLGTIETDATVAPRVPFQVENAFMQGVDPFVITLAHDDADGARREANIAVRRAAS